jgi:secreted trypsin-like serine protease
MRLAALAAPAAIPGVAAGPAFALGGSQSQADSGLQAHVMMVLSREGTRHGACTGTVIARDVVLTAAHCVSGKKQVVVAYAESGSHVLQRVTKRAIHPGFSGRARVSVDLALIRLESPLPTRFTPLAIDRGAVEHRIGANHLIAGYGLQREGDEASAGTLRSANVAVLPRLFPRFLRLGTSPGADLSDVAICTGDSGGPVLSGGFGARTVVGVIYGRESFGDARSCGTIGQAVRLAPQAGWIDQTLARWSGEARPRPTR